MGSLILQTATRLIFTLLLMFSVFILLRGHNEPGGGFIAGLVTSGAFALQAIAYDVAVARRALRFDPRVWIAVGLLLAAGSGLPALFMDEPFLTGKWASIAWLGAIKVGTPVLFDIGVYLVVVGVTLTIIFSLGEE